MSESDQEISELALDSAGTRLRRAREAAGLSLADIASRTRIAERHLRSIEAGNFMALASRAYAVGFARNFAREVGLDEDEIAHAVRIEADGQEPTTARYQPASFEPGDPARIPAARVAWIAGLSALAVVIAGYIFWRSFYAPAAPLTDLAPETVASAEAGAVTPAPAGAQSSAQGPVVFTALEQGIWVRFYDAAGTQLLQKELSLGESYTVPADANGPMIRTARPEALQVSIGGRIVAKLADRQVTIGDVPVSAAALLARGQVPAASASPSQSPTAAPATPGIRSTAPTPLPTSTSRRETPKSVPSRAAPRSVPTADPSSQPVVQPIPASPAPASSPQSSTVSQ